MKQLLSIITLKKIKVYELDFGDTNLLSEDREVITQWIDADMDGLKKETDELNYVIKVKFMTRRQINALPEWS